MIEVSKRHVLGQNKGKFGISEKLQTLMSMTGQGYSFEEGAEILKETMGIDVNARQIQRVSEHYGKVVEEQIEKYDPEVLPQIEVKDKEDPVYIMVDGSMYFTRERGWMEMKLGRLFSGSQRIDIQEARTEIAHSVYVSHLGTVSEFFQKLEKFLIHYKHKVIVGDGAKWIWKWAEDNYPGATQILDLYHALEKIGIFASLYFKDEKDRKNWMDNVKEQLLENKVDQIIQKIKTYRPRNHETKNALSNVIHYYEEHEDRMQYKTYREKGLLVGSGPIESAHRNVLQHRLKLSGQRWSIQGAQYIANLRCMKKSNNWNAVINLIKNAA